MSPTAEALRLFWVPGLNEVTGPQIKDISGWICDEEFQVYSPIEQEDFTLFVDRTSPLLNGYAAEITRISIAAFETLSSVARLGMLTKSTAWMVIKTYYASFYAAHSIMRMFGISCTPTGRAQIKSIDTIATAYGYPIQHLPRGGLYELTFNSERKELKVSYIRSISAGPHGSFWRIFCLYLEKLIPQILTSATLTVQDQQSAATKIQELISNLSFGGGPKANWLSMVRNVVNYDQGMSAWYPYQNRPKYYEQLFSHVNEWKSDMSTIDLISHQDEDLRRFQATCNCIVALCREMAQEMATRCSTGKSFHRYGSLACLNLLGQPH
jgi:hypothetical protein